MIILDGELIVMVICGEIVREISRENNKLFSFTFLVAQRMGLDMSLEIHHFNSNTFDHRRENLKASTRQQIQMNRGKHCNNKSGFKGVVVCNGWRGKFRAQTTVNSQPITIGYFDNPEDAYQAYCDYVQPIHGLKELSRQSSKHRPVNKFK
ncbi:hypothetical protein A6769_34790 [Nostoc punctiforme NIES-2108]|uniref:AP2/ERF domain-containing protein n=1 Tax=Nostoc punctiforme NIES-2108 TaxID=1356359 RepID=A0A367R1G0_NOSPU|nr:hypothetical protein A6769_34790 [Nostoc punctiforme NIES-2108]